METDMADYYTHFSCLFDVGTHENAMRALDLYQNAVPNEDDHCPSDGFVLSLPEEGGTKLRIHDDVSGDPNWSSNSSCSARRNSTSRVSGVSLGQMFAAGHVSMPSAAVRM
jgi:hypothetical protein